MVVSVITEFERGDSFLSIGSLYAGKIADERVQRQQGRVARMNDRMSSDCSR